MAMILLLHSEGFFMLDLQLEVLDQVLDHVRPAPQVHPRIPDDPVSIAVTPRGRCFEKRGPHMLIKGPERIYFRLCQPMGKTETTM